MTNETAWAEFEASKTEPPPEYVCDEYYCQVCHKTWELDPSDESPLADINFTNKNGIMVGWCNDCGDY
jgi:hypothetical protein